MSNNSGYQPAPKRRLTFIEELIIAMGAVMFAVGFLVGAAFGFYAGKP